MSSHFSKFVKIPLIKWDFAQQAKDLMSNPDTIDKMEKEIVSAIGEAFFGQTEDKPALTKGEHTAIEVKNFLLNSLEESMTIQSICEQFDVSDKTLQSAFKSLFGITPKHFMELLKLNHAHTDLKSSTTEDMNVSAVAMKWGFSHFGRFSERYRDLFGNFPSETLSHSV